MKLTQSGKTLWQWRKLLKEKEVTSEEIIKYYLKQIKQKNNQLNVYLHINKKALQEAKKADKKRQEGRAEEKPLLGLPIAVKDNFCTLAMPTTASSKVLENYQPPYQATVVKKLVNAGAIILGKTNMDAWAHGSSTETSAFGPTKNPHNLAYAPGGSSGGSAAAVAADLAPAAIGSETAGSIRQPAAWCGTVGFKPTYGRVSRWGLIAMSSSLDCPGPLTKTVADAAFLYNILAGPDRHDATTIKEKAPLVSLKNNKKQFAIGIPREYLELAQADIQKALKIKIKALKKLGHQIKIVSLLDPKISMAVYTIIQRAEVSSNLARYDGIRYGGERSSFGLEAKRRIMLGTFVLSAGYFDQYYRKAQKVRTAIVQDFQKAFQEIDLLIAPTTPTPALKLGAWKKSAMFGEKQDILVESSALAGLPAISLNIGFDRQRLPIGMQIIGPQKEEKQIFNLAFQIEKII